MRKLLIAFAAVVGLFAMTANPALATNDKVAICHATASQNNPYVSIEVSINSVDLNGHDGHGADIIPPFSRPGPDYPGKNWNEAGQAIWNNDCVTGPVGPQGPAGPTGPQGPTGPAGPPGEDGEDGQDGRSVVVRESEECKYGGLDVFYYWGGEYEQSLEYVGSVCNGAPGKDGANGANGSNGSNGTDGAPGANGKDGTNGTNGSNGTNGRDGRDADVCRNLFGRQSSAPKGKVLTIDRLGKLICVSPDTARKLAAARVVRVTKIVKQQVPANATKPRKAPYTP